MKKLSRASLRSAFIFWLLLNLALSAIGAKLFLMFTNTLENNGRWTSTKAELPKGANGALAYFITPIALDKNRLNLGAWFGFQEVLLREKTNPKEVSFDFEIKPDGYVAFLYNRGPEGYSGIRISRNEAFPHLHFKANAKGQFLEKTILPSNPIEDGTHRFRASFGENSIHFFLDDKPISEVKESPLPNQIIGVRSGYAPVWIDNLVMVQVDSPPSITETFSNPQSFSKIFLIGFLILNLLGLILYFLFLPLKGTRAIYYPITFNFIFLLIALPLSLLDYSYLSNTYLFSKLYFRALTLRGDYINRIETKAEAIARLHQQYPFLEKDQAPPTVLFLGSSQTWGSGADSEQETTIRKLQESFKIEPGALSGIRFINGGISGETGPRLYQLYSQDFFRWYPKLVVLILSNNDRNPEEFRSAIADFIRFNRERGAKTALVLEPNSIEAIRDNLPKNHQILREIADREGIPFIDLQTCLTDKKDEGFLWWDFVHLTSFGQSLAAECLIPGLRGLFR